MMPSLGAMRSQDPQQAKCKPGQKSLVFLGSKPKKDKEKCSWEKSVPFPGIRVIYLGTDLGNTGLNQLRDSTWGQANQGCMDSSRKPSGPSLLPAIWSTSFRILVASWPARRAALPQHLHPGGEKGTGGQAGPIYWASLKPHS